MATITGTNVTRNVIKGSMANTQLGGNTYIGAGTADIISTGESSARYGSWFGIDVSNAGVITITGSSGTKVVFQGFEQFKFSDITINLGTAGADTITGSANNDTWLYGLGGNDTINGGAGTDTVTMQGAKANYTVTATTNGYQIVDNTGADGTDQLIGVENLKFTDGTYSVSSLVTVVVPVTPVIIDGSANADNLTGNSVSNTINGLGGNDIITASGGTDTMNGGAGNDTYNINDAGGHIVFENANEGTDTVNSAVTYTLTANVENLVLTGSAAINGTGNAAANVITGNSGNNILNGGAGNDTITGGGGSDTVVLSGTKASYTFSGTAGNLVTVGADGTDTLINITSVQFSDGTYTPAQLLVAPPSVINGDGGNNSLTGTNGNDTINGLAGNDTMDGLGGTDTLVGGAGDDIYVVDTTTDTITELGNDGTDTVQSSVTFSLAALGNVENLTLTGGSMIDGTGNAAANVITGNGSNNTLTGGGGNDTLIGNGGTDTAYYSGTKASYTVTVTDATHGTINGGEGLDTLTGITSLHFSDGTVTLASYLPPPASVINGTAGDDANLQGTAAADTVNGLGGNDTINGLGGVDVLVGGAGNDIYVVDTATDTITELLNDGTDTVQSSVTQTGLANNVENLTLTGASAINGTGNALANTITGNSADNILNGGLGDDILIGGGGVDIAVYSGTKASYTVTTANGTSGSVSGADGTDTLTGITKLQFSDGLVNLSDFIPVTGGGTTGTAANDTLTGTAGNDVFTGGGGNDILNGGGGVDTAVFTGNKSQYTIVATDATHGTVTDGTANRDGVDTLNGITKLQFADGLVDLAASIPSGGGGGGGSGPINGTASNDTIGGTAGADTMFGLAGNDIINGKGGADVMVGGMGNDQYYVSQVGDIIREVIGQGTDTVLSTITIAALTKNVENLKLLGSANINGIGNAGNNVITGNSGANLLSGSAGNDRLVGAGGHDVLTGGLGKDVFDFNTLGETKSGTARDRITDFTVGVDKIDLSTIDANSDDAGNDHFIMQVKKGIAFTGYEGQLHFSWVGANTIVEGDINGDRHADFQIELSGHKTLHASDFIL